MDTTSDYGEPMDELLEFSGLIDPQDRSCGTVAIQSRLDAARRGSRNMGWQDVHDAEVKPFALSELQGAASRRTS